MTQRAWPLSVFIFTVIVIFLVFLQLTCGTGGGMSA
jgi:hypothetical protein